MIVQARAGRLSLAIAVLALFGALILLIGSLDELTFQPGKLFYRAAPSDEYGSVRTQTSLKLTRSEQIYAYILGGLTMVSIVCVLLFRKLRRLLFQHLFTLFAFVLPLLLGLFFAGKLFAGWFERHSSEAAATAPEIPEAVVSHPPTWSMALAAGAVAVLALGVVLFLVARWFTYRELVRETSTSPQELEAAQEAFAQQAAETANRIRQGRPLQGEVIRCYREMDHLLSRRRQLKPTYLTPREFAEALRRLGIQSVHVEQLTQLFELVRYGEREDAAMAQQALACLDNLREVYGTEENDAVAEN
jgi:hypothetical protein